MDWLWKRVQRNAPVIAGAVVVVINLVVLSGILKLGDKLLGGINALVAACLAFMVAFIVSIQPYRVRRAYVTRVRHRPWEMFPGAGSIASTVVGRDTLCDVLIDDLRSSHTRRPCVIVGGPGMGKTALLMRLASKLAARGYVPVPIGLRDARGNLDFREMARAQFAGNAELAELSDADISKVWLQLCQDDKIVVLADGLEEALWAGPPGLDRESLIRQAIHQAYVKRLPLLIASRPHAPLRGLDATVMALEPLSEDDVLAWTDSVAARGEEISGEVDWRFRWLVDRADAGESPLYLNIIGNLGSLHLLDTLVPLDAAAVQTDTLDRSTVRLRLLQAWEQALVEGDLSPGLPPLRRAEREVTLDWLSVLACIGLKNDSSEVSLSEALSSQIEAAILRSQQQEAAAMPGERGLAAVSKQLAASWGTRLGIVEACAGGVRFQHSLIQAYLGSRLMGVTLTDEYWREALGGTSDLAVGPDQHGPGREFLTALVLHSRCVARQSLSNVLTVPDCQPQQFTPQELCRRLLEAAREHLDPKALQIYATAVEIIAAADQRESNDPPAAGELAHASAGQPPVTLSVIIDAIKRQWPSIRSAELWTLEETKIGLIRRLGEALRSGGDASMDADAESGYFHLYAIGCAEDSYRVRLAAAEEIGLGGCAAYAELRDFLAIPGTPAWESSQQSERRLSAWVLPMLITSTHLGCARRGEPGSLPAMLRSALEHWTRCAGITGWGYGDAKGLTIPEEIALAQGLKYAANQRHPRNPLPGAREYLTEQALEMLKRVRYWFSELTLVQALTLWALPYSGDNPSQSQLADSRPAGRQPTPDEQIEPWLTIIADKKPLFPGWRRHPVHPLVEAAAELAIKALEAGQPGRFLWMDEGDVVARIGNAHATGSHISRLWITPSMGWSTLAPRAQQLVADVMVLRSLAERNGTPGDVEGRLERICRNDLPPCITIDRRPLSPLRPARPAGDWPGMYCLAACSFMLCPYPPMGMQPYRAELGEEFCRRQYRLARYRIRPERRNAPWQGMRPRRMRQFWSQMAERARTNLGP